MPSTRAAWPAFQARRTWWKSHSFHLVADPARLHDTGSMQGVRKGTASKTLRLEDFPRRISWRRGHLRGFPIVGTAGLLQSPSQRSPRPLRKRLRCFGMTCIGLPYLSQTALAACQYWSANDGDALWQPPWTSLTPGRDLALALPSICVNRRPVGWAVSDGRVQHVQGASRSNPKASAFPLTFAGNVQPIQPLTDPDGARFERAV